MQIFPHVRFNSLPFLALFQAQNGSPRYHPRACHPMAGRDGPFGPRGGLGMGLMGLLQAKRGVPFRPVIEGGGGETMGVEAASSTSSLAALIRRPAAAPDRTRIGGPDQETRRSKHPLHEGHEGTRQRIEGRELKRPKSFAELRNKGANLQSFGKLGRATFVERTGEFPLDTPEEQQVTKAEEGTSPWKDLEFDAGTRFERPAPPEGEHYTLASMYQMANEAAARAKQTLAAAVEFWSPKRVKHKDPVLPEGWPEEETPKQKERCPQSARGGHQRAQSQRQESQSHEHPSHCQESRHIEVCLQSTGRRFCFRHVGEEQEGHKEHGREGLRRS